MDGCYGKLGANHRDMRLVCPNHNPGFDLNEEALCYGASLFVQYAFEHAARTRRPVKPAR